MKKEEIDELKLMTRKQLYKKLIILYKSRVLFLKPWKYSITFRTFEDSLDCSNLLFEYNIASFSSSGNIVRLT